MNIFKSYLKHFSTKNQLIKSAIFIISFAITFGSLKLNRPLTDNICTRAWFFFSTIPPVSIFNLPVMPLASLFFIGIFTFFNATHELLKIAYDKFFHNPQDLQNRSPAQALQINLPPVVSDIRENYKNIRSLIGCSISSIVEHFNYGDQLLAKIISQEKKDKKQIEDIVNSICPNLIPQKKNKLIEDLIRISDFTYTFITERNVNANIDERNNIIKTILAACVQNIKYELKKQDLISITGQTQWFTRNMAKVGGENLTALLLNVATPIKKTEEDIKIIVNRICPELLDPDKKEVIEDLIEINQLANSPSEKLQLKYQYSDNDIADMVHHSCINNLVQFIPNQSYSKKILSEKSLTKNVTCNLI